MRIQLTAAAFDELSAFAQAVRTAESERRIRVVIGKSKNAHDKIMMLRAGLDRGELDGIEFRHEQSGLEFIFVHNVLSESDEDVVFWLRNMDDLTLEKSPKASYVETMGDAQGKLILLLSDG
jgi:hypothetical protein